MTISTDYVFLILWLNITIKSDFIALPLTFENYPQLLRASQYFKFANLSNILTDYVFLILLLEIPIKFDYVVSNLGKPAIPRNSYWTARAIIFSP